MKTKLLLSSLLIVPLGIAVAQEKKPTPASAPTMDDPVVQRMIELGTPGPEHEMLASMIGTWKADMKHWMAPDAPVQTSTGTSTSKWVLQDHYVETTYTGDVMGMPFEGRGISGYDKFKKKYFATWMDSMSTGFMLAEGSYDPGTKTYTYTGQSPDCNMEKLVTVRQVVKVKDADHHTFEMYMPGPDGKEFKALEIHYTRAK